MANQPRLMTYRRLPNGRMVRIGPGARVHAKDRTKLHHGSWLTVADIEKIKQMSSEGYTQREIGDEFGVSAGTVSRIVRDLYKSVVAVQPPHRPPPQTGTEEDASEFSSAGAAVAVGLWGLAEVQGFVSALVEGAVPAEGELPTPQQVRDTVLALVDELLECMHELDWKPWKRRDSVDVDKVAEEFADVLAFLGLFVVLLQHQGLDPDVLALAYVAKSERNKARLLGQAADYKARALSRRAEEILASMR